MSIFNPWVCTSHYLKLLSLNTNPPNMDYLHLIDESIDLIFQLQEALESQTNEVERLKTRIKEFEGRNGDDYLERCLRKS